MRKVVVTGLGAVTPLGVGVSTSWKRLLDAQSGIVGLDAQNYAHDASRQRCRVAGLIPGPRIATHQRQILPSDGRRNTSVFTQHALVAAREALKDAQWSAQTASQAEMAGVCLGSGIGSLDTIFDASAVIQTRGTKRISPHFIPKLLTNSAAGRISIEFGLKGPSHAASTACATGANSIGDAARIIACGDANVMLAGGAESCVHPLAFAGFESLRSLSTSYNERPVEASRPFDKARDGFVIGEGAAVLVLEELEHAKGRGVPIYAEVMGYGQSSDAYHQTSPPVDGNGASRAMQRALIQAGLAPKHVDYINAHATSTRLGDAAELCAIETLMRDCWRDRVRSKLCVSSNKGAIGHLLGAAGAIEAIFTILAIRDSVIPPTLNLTHPDNVASSGIDLIRTHSTSRHLQVCLSNSFGFGGTNVSLCFVRYTK